MSNLIKVHYNQITTSLLSRCILSMVFLLSGVTKIFNLSAFAYETRMYADAYISDELQAWITPVSIGICMSELSLGILALKDECQKIVSWGFFLFLAFFVWLTGINYFFPSIMGSIESCGCFGELIHFTPLASFVKSLVLWFLSVVLLYLSNGKKWHLGRLLLGRFFYKAVGSVSILTLFSFLFFDEMDHNLYTSLFLGLVASISFFLYLSQRNDS